MSGDVSGLPSTEVIESAPLPDNYQAAKQVLAECTAVDECKDWADKAVAMASYARQVNDDSLLNMAKRIHSRAIRRVGELRREADGRQGQNLPTTKKDGAVLFSPTGTELATEAGLSERQQKTAARVANIPAEEFEAAVESDDPPTVTKLAEMGKRKREKPPEYLEGIDPKVFNTALHLTAAIERVMERIRSTTPTQYAAGLRKHERAPAIEAAQGLATWLQGFLDQGGTKQVFVPDPEEVTEAATEEVEAGFRARVAKEPNKPTTS